MTKIEWTQRPGTKGKTWNPMRARNKKTGGVGHFCEKVSPGCKNCYAETFQKRFKNPVRYAAQDADQVEVFLDEKTLLEPLKWRKPATVFVCSQTDVFLRHYSNEWIDQLFAIMALCPQHTFIILTKRHGRMREYISLDTSVENIHGILSSGGPKNWDCHKELEALGGKYFSGQYGEFGMCELPPGYEDIEFDWPLNNVWLGVSVEDQKAANERIPVLLDTPAAVRFLSAEPLLGPVDLTDIVTPVREGVTDHFDALDHIEAKMFEDDPNGLPALDWVIVGGESGHDARPMHPDWARSLRDQCKDAGVSFFFKQWGTWMPQIGAKDDVSDNPEISKYTWKEWGPDQGLWEDRGRPAWSDDLDPDHSVIKVGKKAAGRSLDGVEHNEWPEVVK